MSDKNLGPMHISFDGENWEDVPAVTHHALFALSKNGELINPLTLIDIDDLREAVALIERFRALMQEDVDIDGDSQSWWTVHEIDEGVLPRLKALIEHD